ncbi:ABC transporter permease [Aurantiacibacter sediminis]|uniref:ABC transporter permease n=1 Tax=Aurantiacibacter sediminis TaxID=2793064 RepID=A0ABS0N6B1_9SPHN|nr:ABC transporter permease [Aurantiacibacter sediminis]MBH5323362.1 ABC transporter permease [Aurantiacibacter sediminis]
MMALIRAELAKLNGSLALLFMLAVPALTAALALLAIVTNGSASNWNTILGSFVLPLWVMFIYPMATATFATLTAQVEYRAKAWDHLLALPFSRWQIFAAKWVVVQASLALMTALLFAYSYILISTGGLLIGSMPVGDPAFAKVANGSLRLLAAGMLFSTIQLWIALRFGNFVIPLAVGIAGTLVGMAVVITGSSQANWFPWVMTINAAKDGWESSVVGGLIGGAIALALMLTDLSKRSLR